MPHNPHANQVILVEPLVERVEMLLIGQVQELKIGNQPGDLIQSLHHACVLIPDHIPDIITLLEIGHEQRKAQENNRRSRRDRTRYGAAR